LYVTVPVAGKPDVRPEKEAVSWTDVPKATEVLGTITVLSVAVPLFTVSGSQVAVALL